MLVDVSVVPLVVCLTAQSRIEGQGARRPQSFSAIARVQGTAVLATAIMELVFVACLIQHKSLGWATTAGLRGAPPGPELLHSDSCVSMSSNTKIKQETCNQKGEGTEGAQ